MGKRITPRHIEAVDDLGHIQAKISALQDDEKDLKDFLNKSGHTEIDGHLFRVTVSHSARAQVAWKQIAIKAGASSRLIKANTSTIPVDSVRCVSRKTSS